MRKPSSRIVSAQFALAFAWLVALTSTLSVLYLGEVMGQMPCLLCWYQRAMMFPLPVILGLGFWWNDLRVGRYSLALSILGGGIALWHLGLYFGYIPERILPCSFSGPSCTDDNQVILGIPIPLLSLVAFALTAVFSTLSLEESQR